MERKRKIIKRSEIEIMAPVGSYASLVAAIDAGADSIYFGVEQLNMRAKSSANFTLDDLSKIVAKARKSGVKTYLTVNTVLYDDEMEVMREVIDGAKKEGVDAVIVADQAAIIYARSVGMNVHVSTQVNISNTESVRFYSQWADVVVLARELNLNQIKRISQAIEQQNIVGPSGQRIKIEMFAHGAMCMAISGKCYMSLHETGCSANRGACRQLCRRAYTIKDKDTGEELNVEGQYILSPKDLATIEFLDDFIDAGVRVLKIEGRARSAEYVKRVVESYDQALKEIEKGTYTKQGAKQRLESMKEVFNRGFWGGYYLGAPMPHISERYGSSATKKKVYVGKVTNFFKKPIVAEILIEAAILEQGDEIVILGDTTGAIEAVADEIYIDKKRVEEASQKEICSIKLSQLVRRGDKLYKLVPSSKDS